MRKVAAVPTAGIVTKVGRKVPIILPMVFKAPSSPTVFPLSSRLLTENFTRDGVTVPSRTQGNAKIARQVKSAAQTRKLDFIKTASSKEIPAIRYLPANGMSAIHIAAIKSLRYSLSGSWRLSAERPPHTFPIAIAIMITPMITVHTIWEELK